MELLKNTSSENLLSTWTQLSHAPKCLRKLTQDGLESFWSFLVDATSSAPKEIIPVVYACISKLVLDVNKQSLRKLVKLGAPMVLTMGFRNYFEPQNSSSK